MQESNVECYNKALRTYISCCTLQQLKVAEKFSKLVEKKLLKYDNTQCYISDLSSMYVIMLNRLL